MAVSINKICSAEFGDIFLFLIFKGNIELLFWSKVFNPFCIFLASTLLSLRLRSWGEKNNFKNRSESHVMNKIYVVSLFLPPEINFPVASHILEPSLSAAFIPCLVQL